jgi:hypothetical protein
MNKFIGIVLILMLLGFVTQSWSGERQVTINWEYLDPPTDLNEFELRVNGDNDTVVHIALDQRMWQGLIEVNDDNNTFEVRACDLSGQCSDWSNPCAFNPEPLAPTITNCSELIIDASVDGDSVDVRIRWAVQRE